MSQERKRLSSIPSFIHFLESKFDSFSLQHLFISCRCWTSSIIYVLLSFSLFLSHSLLSLALSLCCFSKNNSLKGEGVLSSIFRASLYFFLSFISLIAIILMVMPFLSFSRSHFVLSSLSHSFLSSSTNSFPSVFVSYDGNDDGVVETAS